MHNDGAVYIISYEIFSSGEKEGNVLHDYAEVNPTVVHLIYSQINGAQKL